MTRSFYIMATKIVKNISIILGGLALIALAVFYGFSGQNLPTQIIPGASQSPTQAASQNFQASAVSTQTGPGLPVHLSIPSIKVDAQVISVGLAADGSIGVPKGPYQVAWFKLGPRPGSQGSAILTGHFGPWKSGAHSVFDNLSQLKKGDVVYVKDDKGKRFSFVVTGSKIYNPNDRASEVFSNKNGVHLNLITCNGDWIATQKTYTQRLVIFTDLAK